MAINFQFNKTSLQQLDRELKVRLSALPILKAKESALRLEVKKAKAVVMDIKEELEEMIEKVKCNRRLWSECPNLLSLSELSLNVQNIAGVKIPEMEGIQFHQSRFAMFGQPHWIMTGVETIKAVAGLKFRLKVAEKRVNMLAHARKKTTQKVNLYEKVQVPDYEEAILKIKRFLEDEENLGKSAQKILKTKKSRVEASI